MQQRKRQARRRLGGSILKCANCDYEFTGNNGTCPSCAYRDPGAEAQTWVSERKMAGLCQLIGCASPQYGVGLCLAHFDEFMGSAESMRARTAIADWARRKGLL